MFWVGKVRLTIEHYNIDWIGFTTVSFSVCRTFQYSLSHSVGVFNRFLDQIQFHNNSFCPNVLTG